MSFDIELRRHRCCKDVSCLLYLLMIRAVEVSISSGKSTSYLSSFQSYPTQHPLYFPSHIRTMDHTNMNHQAMSSMPTTFFTSTSTALYVASWVPKTASQYALTCLFLVFLCIAFRALLATRCNLANILAHIQARKDDAPEQASCCGEESGLDKPLRGILAPDGPTREHDEDGPRRYSRVYEVLLRALLDTVLAFVSYLL